MNLRISIGILAYNEFNSIGKTLHSLFQQSIFTQEEVNHSLDIEVIIVPNGCIDHTATVSQMELELIAKQRFSNGRFLWKVCRVSLASKASAWNLYVHKFSNPDADYLILMDADIYFLEPKTLQNLIRALEETPSAAISTDQPIKDVSLKSKKTLIEKLSVSVSQLSGASKGDVWICGQLYCGRASVLRDILIPLGVEMDDEYVWKMVVTEGLKSPENPQKVVRAEDASHIFEAYINLISLLRHEKWLIVAKITNSFVFAYLKTKHDAGEDVLLLIKRKNESDPDWVARLVQANISKSGFWVIPNWFLYRRLRGLKKHGLIKKLILLPLALLAFFVDACLCIYANYELHQK